MSQDVDRKEMEPDPEGRYLYFDDEMASFEEYYKSKRKELQRVRGQRRCHFNRYLSPICRFTEEKKDNEMECHIENESILTTENTKDITNERVHDEVDKANGSPLSSPKVTESTESMVNYTTTQIIDKLNAAIDRFEVLKEYQSEICMFFEENQFNGLKLSRMSQSHFVQKVAPLCGNSTKVKAPLTRLFKSFEFGDRDGMLFTHYDHYNILYLDYFCKVDWLQFCNFAILRKQEDRSPTRFGAVVTKRLC